MSTRTTPATAAAADAGERRPTLERLANLARIGTEAAVAAGAQQADTAAGFSRSVSAELRGTGVHTVKLDADGGVGIRAFVDGGMGYAFTMRLEEDAVREVAARAARLARAAQPDPHFVSLPRPAGQVDEVAGLRDERLEEMQVLDAARLAEELAALALKREPDAVLSGGIGFTGPSLGVLHSSLGVDVRRRSTSIGGWMMAQLSAGPDDTGSGWEHDGGHSVADFDSEFVASEAVSKARAILGAAAARTRRCTVILSPNAVQGLGHALCGLLNGWSVVYDRTCLGGALGERLSSPTLTLYCDPLVPGGSASSAIDGEGTPRQRFAVMQRGVVKSYLHNSYTAQRLGQANNGCHGRGYAGPGGIGASNLQLELGEQTFADLVRGVDDGVYIDSFPFPAEATGNMSSMIDYGIEIRGGELARGVKGTMIGSTFREFLANVDAVSSEARREPGQVYPYIRVRDVQIAGR